MENKKDRIIRVNNLPRDKALYQLNNKPVVPLLILIFIGVVLYLYNYFVFGILLTIFALFIILVVPNQKLLTITRRYIVSFSLKNRDECLVIYFSEIEYCEYVDKKDVMDKLLIKCTDGTDYEITVFNRNRVIRVLSKYCTVKKGNI